MTDASTVLKRAAKRLRTTGWQRYEYGPKEGPNCMVGAILTEAGDPSDDDWYTVISDAKNALRVILHEDYSAQADGIIGINDRLIASTEEAAQCLDKASTRVANHE